MCSIGILKAKSNLFSISQSLLGLSAGWYKNDINEVQPLTYSVQSAATCTVPSAAPIPGTVQWWFCLA